MDFMKIRLRRLWNSVTIDSVRKRAKSDARFSGYELHTDPSILDSLLEGLRLNEERYTYPSCPCRLASGDFERDRDIICPCDYRDADIQEFGFCYCGLYVRPDVVAKGLPITPIPEQRPLENQINPITSIGDKETHKVIAKASVKDDKATDRTKTLWFCRQCGYVCFREKPPPVCPICGAKQEFFAEVLKKNIWSWSYVYVTGHRLKLNADGQSLFNIHMVHFGFRAVQTLLPWAMRKFVNSGHCSLGVRVIKSLSILSGFLFWVNPILCANLWTWVSTATPSIIP